jgi:hypothetical protein
MAVISLCQKIDFPIILGKLDLSAIDSSTKPKPSTKEKCCYCGNNLHITGITKDHLIPKIKGGNSLKINLKLCCTLCNTAKGSKYAEEFLYHFILKYRNRKGEKSSKYRHISNFKKMLKNTLYVIAYIRGHGDKLFNDESYYQLYKETRTEFNYFINYLNSKEKKKLTTPNNNIS